MFGITNGELEIMIILLPIDAMNLYLLVRLWKWSQTAGKNLISQVVKALNLNYGDHKEKIGEAIKGEALTSLAEALPEDVQNALPGNINYSALIQGFLNGEVKKEDIIRLAPVILKNMKSKQVEPGQKSGRW